MNHPAPPCGERTRVAAPLGDTSSSRPDRRVRSASASPAARVSTRPRLRWVLVCLACLSRALVAAPVPPAPTVITNLDVAIRLSLDEAGRELAVQAPARVTYCHPEWGMLFVLGDTYGTYLPIAPSYQKYRPGEVVEIDATTSAGRGYPELKVREVRRTGRQAPLFPSQSSLAQILDGSASCEWAMVEGDVLAAYETKGRWLLRLRVGSTNLSAYLLQATPELARHWIDARVRVQGVVSVLYDARGNRTGVALLAQETNQVLVVQAPASSPLDLPLTPLSRILSPTGGKSAGRVRFQGTLEGTLEGPQPGLVARVRDRSFAVRLECSFPPDAPEGVGVEVLGYPTFAHGEWFIREAIVFPNTAALPSPPPPASGGSTPNPNLPTLDSARAVHRLSREEAARGYPVRLEAVVTYSDPLWWMLFVHDATEGVFVVPRSTDVDVRPGHRVRVEGTSAPGNFSPVIDGATLTVLGDGPLPEPVRPNHNELLSGQFDCAWVAVTGLVQSRAEDDGRSTLRIRTRGGTVFATLAPSVPVEDAERLVDARISAAGAVGVQLNRQRQLVDVRLHIPGLSAIQILEPPPRDPFSLPTTPIGALLLYRPDEDLTRRTKVAGVVTCVLADGTVCLQDPSGGMVIRSQTLVPNLAPGHRIEALGFPTPGDFTATLLEPRFRNLGPGPEPEPFPATSAAILEGQHASTLVHLEARLLEDTRPQPGASLVLQAGSVVLEAMVPDTPETYPSAPWPAGTQLAVTGVVVLQLGPGNQPKSFRLLPRRLSDFTILSRPSWWNLHRLVRILGLVAAAGSFVLAWSLVLARKNRELRRANVEALAANQAKSRFLATMSHEIRTPLNGVTGMLHLLLRDDPTPKQRHRIELAQSSASTLLRVINDILDFSRIEAGKLEIHPAPTALRPTIAKASTPASLKVTEKGLAWNVVISPETPEWVVTDPDRLTQILGNLLGNAAKFTETGSITLRVKPIPCPADTVTVVTVRFEVTDTGPGIAPEQVGRLFKPFSQVDSSSTRRHGGTGLGLGICKELAELMGGRIGVQSQPGAGSTFWLELPLPTTVAPPADATPPPPAPPVLPS